MVSSKSTSKTLSDLFDVGEGRFNVIPLSGGHTVPKGETNFPAQWSWSSQSYLIYAANVSPHKNHEILFDAYANWREENPLVLTGEGTDLKSTERGQVLGSYAERLGIQLYKSLIPLGYVSSEVYDQLIDGAWCVVMCSLSEGGGSFPVWEAMLRGIPVICADIPVMKEHIERTGGDVVWFDPFDSSDLTKKLTYLKENYHSLRQTAEEQVSKLIKRSWMDVGHEYLRIFDNLSKSKNEAKS